MSIATVTVLSENKIIDSIDSIVSIDIRAELNRIPYARITMVDGDTARGIFAISNMSAFEPGKRIEIKVRLEGRGSENVSLFAGIVVGHGVAANSDGSSFLNVELKDEAVKSTLVRRRAVYREMTDRDVAKQIIAKNRLKSGRLEAAKTKHAELVQYNCTDWDFLLSRAEANGLVVVVDKGMISIAKINPNGHAKHHFEPGIDDVHGFEVEAGAESQLAGVESRAWDIAAQAPTQPARAENFSLDQGNLNGERLAEAFGLGEPYQMTNPVPLAPEELQAWSNGRLMRSRLSLIRGRLAVPGLPDIYLLDLIGISGIGKRFDGITVVTGLHHRIDAQGLETNIQFGLTARQFAERRDLSEVPAAGLLPAVNGLQIGVVGEFQEDPTGNLRVKVLLPGIDPIAGFVWARLAAPEAGRDRGYFFRPEQGDEVVIGFFNDDPRQAVILGGLFSSANTAPKAMAELSEENIHKGIVTKSGTTIQFVDEEKGSLIIQTASENKILLSDDTEVIEISDQHGNALKLGAGGIEIMSARDIKIEAKGIVEIAGKQVDVK